MKIISKKRYNYYKTFDFENMSTEDMVQFRKSFGKSVAQVQEMMKAYEDSNIAPENKAQKEYFDKITNKKPKSKIILTKENLWKAFTDEYFKQQKEKYATDNESIENIKPLIYYFLRDQKNFDKCKNVINGKKNIPNINKGILIVGNYGTGKTSSMKAFEAIFKRTNYIFKGFSCNDVVTQYESCNNPKDKEMFFKKMNRGIRYFDDLLSEKQASNYGKHEIMKDILEIRYENKKLTFLSMNYDPEYPNNIEKALEQIYRKYGMRVYDRIFKVYNIIEFKGKSRRK